MGLTATITRFYTDTGSGSHPICANKQQMEQVFSEALSLFYFLFFILINVNSEVFCQLTNKIPAVFLQQVR